MSSWIDSIWSMHIRLLGYVLNLKYKVEGFNIVCFINMVNVYGYLGEYTF